MSITVATSSDENTETPGKNQVCARKLEELAAELVNSDDKRNSLKLYNRCIAIAPIRGSDLPITMANKSAVLFEMQKYSECVGNIDLVLKHPDSPLWLFSTLIERKIKCLLKTGLFNEQSVRKLMRYIKHTPVLQRYEAIVVKTRLKEMIKRYYVTNLSPLSNGSSRSDKSSDNGSKNGRKRSLSQNDFETFMSESIKIVRNNTYGRHIVAKAEIETGELLLKEKATVSCPYMSELYEHCSCCLARTEILIPCCSCSKALFCSEYCLIKAVDQYHRVECPLMEYFFNLDPEDQHVQYVLRIVCFLSKQGRTLEDLVEKWCDSKSNGNDLPDETVPYTMPVDLNRLFLSLNKYTYSPAQFLCSQSRYRKLVDMLYEQTDFFLYVGGANKQYFFHVVASLFIEIEAHCKCNTFCISDIFCHLDATTNGDTDYTGPIRRNVGFTNYKMATFFNHSCVPNASYAFENGDTIAVYSVRRIRPGEQIFICYLNTYYEVSRVERDLSSGYSFQCRCAACDGGWPTGDQLQSVFAMRFCDCEQHSSPAVRRMSLHECIFCRFKRDLAMAVRTLGRKVNAPLRELAIALKTDVADALQLFRSLDGIEGLPGASDNLVSHLQ